MSEPTPAELERNGKCHKAIREVIKAARKLYPAAHSDKILRIALATLYDDLTVRIAAIEARPSLKYCGVWKGALHKEGEAVTHDGSMWIAKRATLQRPGASEDWQLCVKRGKDAR